MKQLSEKINIIYKPFLLITIGFILVYTFLSWLLFIKIGIQVKEDLIKFWIPYALPWVPILIWLRPRLKLLDYKRDKNYFLMQLLASFAIIAPTIIAQEYLFTATGKLTELENINQISNFERTKYYTLKKVYINKENISVQNTATVTGKNSQHFNMEIYVVMPILEKATDTTKTKNTFWLGKKYHKQISNRLSGQEKQKEFNKFAEDSQKEFEKTNFYKFTYLEVIGNTDEHDEFNRAIKKIKPAIENDIVFLAKTEPYQAKNGNTLLWMFISLGIGMIAYFIFLALSKFDEKKLQNFKKGKIVEDTDIKEFFSFFIPKENFFITPIIIDLNILIFIIMVFSGLGLVAFKADDLLTWGANFKPFVINGQWWRLLTSTFLHGGLMHILANMVGLLFVGIFLEPLLGKTKYLLIYLTTGITASITSIWWHEATVSVGASGAIFGLYGFFLACLLFKVFPSGFSKSFLISTLIFLGFNLLMGLTGGIDNAAHIGGLASGFIIGITMSGQLKSKKQSKQVASKQNNGQSPNNTQ